jgi:hypothetical protein
MGTELDLELQQGQVVKTFSWLFDTEASVTCVTAESFKAAFPHSEPHRVQNAQHCTGTSGNQMNSLGIFEIDLQIKGKTFKHNINVINQLKDNIIGINFMHKHKLHYNVQTRQVKIAGIKIDQIVAIKEQPQPALAAMVLTAKYKGKVHKDMIYIASILHPTPQLFPACQQLSQSTGTTTAKLLLTIASHMMLSSKETTFLASWTSKQTN